MVFNIGSQHAEQINNVAGNQWNQVTIGDEEARRQVRSLRAALERAGLPADVEPGAWAYLHDVETEMQRPAPRKVVVARGLKKLTDVVLSAGALANAGAAVAGPLGAVAGWLGGLGKPILDVLNQRS